MTLFARHRLAVAALPFTQPAHCVDIGLFVQEPSVSAALHILSYEFVAKFVKMLESFIKVYYTIHITGGNNNDF